MTTITLQIDAATAQRARRVAEQRQTTLDVLVAEYLEQLARAVDQPRAAQVHALLETLREVSRPMGGKPWKDRDELYER